METTNTTRWKARYWVYLMLFLLTTINYLDRVVLSVGAGPIAADLHVDKIQLGYLFSSFLWGYALFLIPIGLLVDRFGARSVTAISMTVWSLATMLTGAASSALGVLMARIVMGAGEASCYPSAASIIRDWAPSRERGVAMTALNSGAYFGPALGALALSWLVSTAGWRWSFAICGAIGFIWIAVWLLFFKSPERSKWIREEERETILRERETAEQTDSDTASIGLGGLLRERTMWAQMLTQGCNVYTQYLFLTWLPNYLQTERGMTLLGSGTAMAIPYLGSIFISMALGFLSDSTLDPAAVEQGRRRRLVGAVMSAGAVIVFIPLVSNVWAVLGLITVALGAASAGIALNVALLGDLLRTRRDIGRAVALQFTGGNIFGFFAPIVTGYIVQATGHFSAAIIAAGIIFLVGAMSSWFLTWKPIGAHAAGMATEAAAAGRRIS
ncbi:MFS transporter [Sodalis ligni]|uniref:ACS family glucarate transporter-like MFS transporter n=1 Tax=Sodalis ligni TaxID=2697027 RepID=A0A4R1NFQ1_9GAMM|nr:MFS transporter [Sodalis ligni]TCL05797.1 ACS family glucarate transporter-like MFS transporter [Sodalis ligni]